MGCSLYIADKGQWDQNSSVNHPITRYTSDHARIQSFDIACDVSGGAALPMLLHACMLPIISYDQYTLYVTHQQRTTKWIGSKERPNLIKCNEAEPESDPKCRRLSKCTPDLNHRIQAAATAKLQNLQAMCSFSIDRTYAKYWATKLQGTGKSLYSVQHSWQNMIPRKRTNSISRPYKLHDWISQRSALFPL